MDQQLTNYVASVATLSDLRNISPTNPVIFQLEQPLTANKFTVVGSITEPSFMGIPIFTTWICLNPASIYNGKALKLISTDDPTGNVDPLVIQDGGFTQTWIEIQNYAEIFADGQYYATSGGTPGPQGPVGPQGPAGPAGPAATIDYDYIVAQVLAAVVVKTLTGLTITGGPSSLNESTSSTYSVTATYSDGTTQVNPPSGVVWSADAAIGTISPTGVLSAPAVTVNTPGVVTAEYTYNGTTMTATKAVTVINVATPIYPFYGVGDVSAVKNEALVLGLPGRGSVGDLLATFTLDSGVAGGTTTMFYAYPASYGLAQFEDQASLGFFGGWDAATGDPTEGASGPLSLNVTINGQSVPFYLYQTDFPGLGVVTWKVTHLP